MKKNKMMRLAAVLLVLTMLTTCAISGTFAKYTTTANESDEARVAAWGFGDSTNITFDLFSESYNSDAIKSSETDVNVIAPGASQTDKVQLNYADTTGKGAPEVAYKVELNVTASECAQAIEDNENITWTFNSESFDTFAEMVAEIEAYEETVAANNLPTIAEDGIEIGWSWAFSTGETADAEDTAMGDAASLGEVSLTIEYVATQQQ